MDKPMQIGFVEHFILRRTIMSRPLPTLGNPKNTIEILNKYKFVFQKKFGQNFLIDEHVLGKIIRSAEITEDDFVVDS